jgi:hypothetical protein
MSDKDLSLAIKEAKEIIDEENSEISCLLMYKVCQNENGIVYYLFYDDNPCFDPTGDCPTKIIKYKNKFICLIDSTEESQFSRHEAYQLTDCSDNDGTDLWNEKAWYIGFSSKKNEYTKLEVNGNDRCSLLPYHYPQLLSYLFDEYNEFHIPRFIFDGYEIVVDDKYESGKNMNDYINNITGTFYFSNPKDPFFNSADSYFATISGMDTLRYHVKDTINRHLFIDSVSYTSFFKGLLNGRKNLDKILRDSTYLFHNENGKWGKMQIQYFNLDSIIHIVDETGRVKE